MALFAEYLDDQYGNQSLRAYWATRGPTDLGLSVSHAKQQAADAMIQYRYGMFFDTRTHQPQMFRPQQDRELYGVFGDSRSPLPYTFGPDYIRAHNIAGAQQGLRGSSIAPTPSGGPTSGFW